MVALHQASRLTSTSPNLDLWIELTTMRQALMRQKRKKLQRFATLLS